MSTSKDDPGFTPAEYEIKTLLRKPVFQHGVMLLRKKWGVPSDGFPDNKSNNAWRDKVEGSMVSDYQSDVFELLHELALAERWYSGVSYYIQTNQPGMLRAQTETPIRFEYEGNFRQPKRVRSMWVQIDADTTEREIIEAFKYSRELFGPFKKKQQPKNLDRDLKVYDHYLKGEKNTIIAAWLNENYEGAFTTEDVKKILQRMKRKLN
ncbi:MAG: hypothetical protein JWN82_565 [Candidatus Saccharibacteria bacterium]|nr:hypothetical protein [Candidatus Saccharibacteria bacterium]